MHHASSLRLVIVWIALMGLAFLSFSLSGHLGRFDVAFALAIAVVKSLLVVLFFMELFEQRFVNALVCLVSAGFVALLLLLMVADILTRHTFPRGPLPVIEETATK
jgi:cytochrome c oxidase subunit 4